MEVLQESLESANVMMQKVAGGLSNFSPEALFTQVKEGTQEVESAVKILKDKATNAAQDLQDVAHATQKVLSSVHLPSVSSDLANDTSGVSCNLCQIVFESISGMLAAVMGAFGCK